MAAEWKLAPMRMAGQTEYKSPSRRVGRIPASIGMELLGGEVASDRGEEVFFNSYLVEV